MNLSAFVISQIRTYVPILVGAGLTWLAATLHVVIDPSTEVALGGLSVAVLSAAYYFVVRVLEKKWPKFGWLLGAAAKPVYPSA